jgi:predicted nucleic acid-binding protein
MNILFDTNVVLDVLLDREPFADDAAFLLSKVEQNQIIGYVCATTVTTIHYLIAKALGPAEAVRHIQSLLSLLSIAPVNRGVLEQALTASFTDFEDAVLHAAACHAGVQSIVTRNVRDFHKATLPVFTPAELINALEVLGGQG